ncbi:hypothetical protein QQS21_011908 [Conoideocrella luteorostrata]|uniref:DUF7702 domain-containing protein n=1 Tax=Conoideocrella luteorostrata TaxID=1105319 RepID=A0AAJ0CEI0_9HYPO|nr:hypothetical protein QQS21_011908 [Conoideocrella luteorostrata]
MTNAGCLACLSLALFGVVYEANIILPLPPQRWKEKIILATKHLVNTAGITMATYGGSPSASNPGGVQNSTLNKLGNILMLAAILSLCWWIWPTGKRVFSSRSHPNYQPAKALLITAGAALPFQLVRLTYNSTYAFIRIPSLDPDMGSFETRLVLIFGTQLIVTMVLIGGGWLSQCAISPSKGLQRPVCLDDV